MNQLTTISKKIVNEENKILRECRGRRLALLGRVYKRHNTQSAFYVTSEISIVRYYFVEYKESGKNCFCTCWDFASNRSETCKHIYAVQYAIRLNLVQEIDHKLPISNKSKSWTEDEYNY